MALINQVRSERGLDQVSFSPLLAAAAQRHSRDMANGRFVNNTGSDGSRTTDRIVQAGYRYDRATEMVAAHATDARTVVQLWLGSSENGAGLLKRDVSEVGIGVSPARTGAPKTEPGPYWTVTFARPVPTLVALSQIRDRTLALINATRVRNGLATLSYDPILNVAAEIHAADMARVDFMDHTGSDRSSPADRAARAGYPSPNIGLENVAQGTIG
ncbi:MAG: CAP domain-containing protein, partial [Pseudomonadota bacterium]